jgi:hypothetical protein
MNERSTELKATPLEPKTGENPLAASHTKHKEQKAQDDMMICAERVKGSLEELLGVIRRYKTDSGGLFLDQEMRGQKILEDVSLMFAHVTFES